MHARPPAPSSPAPAAVEALRPVPQPAKSPLFRPQALSAPPNRLEGELLIVSPVSHWMLLGLTAASALAAIIFLACASYSKKQEVKGYLVPEQGVSKVFAPQGSTVTRVHVREGQLVSKGEVLLSLSTGRVGASGERLDAQLLKLLEQQRVLTERELVRVDEQAEATRARLSARQTQLQAEIAQLESLLALREEQTSLSEQAERAAAGMQEQAPGIVSGDERRQRHAAVLQARLDLEQLRVSLTQKRAEQSEAALDLGAVPREREQQRAPIEQRLKELAAQRLNQGSDQDFSVVAPAAGRVTAIQARQGQAVAGPSPLCAIVPEQAHLEGEIYIPTRAAGWLHEGQTVQLLYAAFPHEHYGVQRGSVRSVSEAVLDPKEVDSPVPLEEPVFSARLQLEREYLEAFGRKHALQPGMLFTGHVILEERSLLEWLLSPLYALSRG